MRTDSARKLGLCLLATVLAGCGGRYGQLKGKVTLNGGPVAGADLAFKSATKAEHEFFGVSGEDGVYQVSYRTFSGLPTGRYGVTVTRHALGDGAPLPAGEEGDAAKSEGRTVKELYLFEAEIAAGDNDVSFELSRGKRPDEQGETK
ncbi:MAG: carboxypeptidase-like regulatory domain-containing protein [Gemmataceae bacterium]